MYMTIQSAPLESYNVGNLETSRMKAISVIAHSIRSDFVVEESDCYFADLGDGNRQHTLEIWQAYASDYATEGQTLMTHNLEHNSRWLHPAERRPDREIGSIALGLLSAELDVRKEAYEVVLPNISTDGLLISEHDERLIRSRLTESWLLTDTHYKYNSLVVAAFTKKLFKTQLLKQLVNEERLLLSNNISN